MLGIDFVGDFFSVVLPIFTGVIMVVATVAIVFWMGWRSTRSYEEAKAQALREADEALKEKANHTSPRAKKQWRGYRRKKSEDHQDDSESMAPRKGILKTPTSGAEGRLSPNKVGFKLDTPPKSDSEKTPRLPSPPTPYPTKTDPMTTQQPAPEKTPPQPIFEEEEEEEEEPQVVPPPEPKPVVEPPKKKQPAKEAAEKPVPPQAPAGKKKEQQQQQQQRAAAPKEGESKKKGSTQSTSAAATTHKKGKGGKGKAASINSESQDVLPASRISDIVGASSLTDEEIQWLIGLLLEKSKANSEWEAPNLKAESNKSLKKQNQELQIRLEEALQASTGHAQKIKELRKEVQAEKARCHTLESSSQAKIVQQGNELNYYKTRAAGLDEEIKQVKRMAEAQNLQKLREENVNLSTQVGHLQQQKQQLSTQLMSAKEALKAPSPSDAGLVAEVEKLKEKLAEMDNLMHRKDHELEQYTKTIQQSHSEILRLKEQVKAHAQENDREALQQQVKLLESSKTELEVKLREAAESQEATRAQMEALRAGLEKAKEEGVSQVRAELQAKHREEVNVLKESLVAAEGAGDSIKLLEDHKKCLGEQTQQLEEQKKQIEGQLQQLEGQKKQIEGQKKQIEDQKKQVEDQKKQIEEKTASSSALEQEVAKLSQQLKEEQASKVEVVKELESQLQAAPPTPNGPTEAEPLLNNGNDEQAKAAMEEKSKEITLLEKKVEDLKSKNNELSESLWKAKDEAGAAEKSWEKKLKQAQEQVEVSASSAKSAALRESYESHRALLQQLFPDLKVDGCDGKYQQWLEDFETQAQDFMSTREKENVTLKGKVRDLEKEREANVGEIKQFRDTLETTMGILQKLRTEVLTSTEEHQAALDEKEAALKAESSARAGVEEELGREKALVSRVREELEKEKEVVSQVREELEACRAANQQSAEGKEEAARLEERLQELEQSRTDMEKQVADLHEELAEKEKAYQKLDECMAAESKLKDEAIRKCNELEVQKKEVSDRLETMKQSNRELNARIGSLLGPSSATDSEV